MTIEPKPFAALSKCPICGKPTAVSHRPFCSKRCADIDLGRWFGETYTLPAAGLNESDEDGEE